MAENESLDFGNNLRMRVVYDAIRNRASRLEVTSRLEEAFIGALRKSLKEFRERGVTLTDLLKSRDFPQAIRLLLRKVQGHDYARLFAEVAATSGPTEKECVAGWIDAIVNKMMDQLCLQIAGSEHYPTIGDAQQLAIELCDYLQPVVGRLVTNLAEDPDWLPKRAPTKGQVPASGTADLMDISLMVGAPSQ